MRGLLSWRFVSSVATGGALGGCGFRLSVAGSVEVFFPLVAAYGCPPLLGFLHGTF